MSKRTIKRFNHYKKLAASLLPGFVPGQFLYEKGDNYLEFQDHNCFLFVNGRMYHNPPLGTYEFMLRNSF